MKMAQRLTIDVADGALPLHVQGPDDGSVPAVLVVPSVFGPAPDLLDRLAGLATDTLVVVPDPFWKTGEQVVPYDRLDDAIARMEGFDWGTCNREMATAVDWAREHGNGRVVGVGICFGGPFVLRMGRAGLLDGVVTWHGSRLEQFLDGVADMDCPVRHHLGGDDPITPPEVVDSLRKAFAGHADCEIVVHPGATHGFTHDGDAYDEAAWQASLASVVELVDRDR